MHSRCPGVAGVDAREHFAHLVDEGRGRKDAGLVAPAEHPPQGFVAVSHVELQHEATVGLFLNYLGSVPDAFADEVGGVGIEKDADGLGGFAAKGAEAVAEINVGRKIRRALEVAFVEGERTHTGERKSAHRVAVEIAGGEIPESVDRRDVVGLHHTTFGLGVGLLAVNEGDFLVFEHGLAEGDEEGFVNRGASGGAERKQAGEFARGKTDGGRERGGEFVEGRGEGAGVGRALVGLERFLGEGEGEQFTFAEVDRGKGGDFLGVIKPEARVVVTDGQAEAVAHKLHVALDGARGDFEFSGEGLRVGERVFLKGVVDGDHSLDGWTRGEEVAFGSGDGRAATRGLRFWHDRYII